MSRDRLGAVQTRLFEELAEFRFSVGNGPISHYVGP